MLSSISSTFQSDISLLCWMHRDTKFVSRDSSKRGSWIQGSSPTPGTGGPHLPAQRPLWPHTHVLCGCTRPLRPERAGGGWTEAKDTIPTGLCPGQHIACMWISAAAAPTSCSISKPTPLNAPRPHSQLHHVALPASPWRRHFAANSAASRAFWLSNARPVRCASVVIAECGLESVWRVLRSLISQKTGSIGVMRVDIAFAGGNGCGAGLPDQMSRRMAAVLGASKPRAVILLFL